MAFCLPIEESKKLADSIRKGAFDWKKYAEANSTEARRAILAEAVTAKDGTRTLTEADLAQLNGQFEVGLLRKSQEAGLIAAAEKILGLKDPRHNDALERIRRIEKILTKDEMKAELADMLRTKSGLNVEKADVQDLINLSKEVERQRSSFSPRLKEVVDQKPGESPTDYGRRVSDYLKKETREEKLNRSDYGIAMALFKAKAESLNPRAADIKWGDLFPVKEGKFNAEFLSNIGGLIKSSVASGDNSFWFNQGVPGLFDVRKSPIFIKNFFESFVDLAKGFQKPKYMPKGLSAAEQVKFARGMREIAVRGEIFSRPDAINGTYAREGISIGLRTEEAYPTSLPERVWVVNKFFRSSSLAYNLAGLRMRADFADYVNRQARRQGIDLRDKNAARPIGIGVDTATGRGHLGTAESSLKVLNNLFFSPRLMKSAFDVLTMHLFDKRVRENPFARKEAVKQLTSMALTWVAFNAVYEFFNPGSTELDPRKAHFGQLKIPGTNTWMTVIGPYRPMMRLIAQVTPTFHGGYDWKHFGFWRQSSKGEWSFIPVYPKKVPEYGAYTPMDAIESFLEGKFSPMMAIIRDHWTGTTFEGKPPTPYTDLGAITPITVGNLTMDLNDPSVQTPITNAFLGFFGINTTQYKK